MSCFRFFYFGVKISASRYSGSSFIICRVRLLVWGKSVALCARSVCGKQQAKSHKNKQGKWRAQSQYQHVSSDRCVNLGVLYAVCSALSCALCINFLLSKFKVFVTRCHSHCLLPPHCLGTSLWWQEMLFSLSSTLGHLVDGSRGSGQDAEVPGVATSVR